MLSFLDLRCIEVIWALPDGMPKVLASRTTAWTRLCDVITRKRSALLRPSRCHHNMQKSTGPVDVSASAEARDEVPQLTVAGTIVKAPTMPTLRGVLPEEFSDALLQLTQDGLEVKRLHKRHVGVEVEEASPPRLPAVWSAQDPAMLKK